MKKMFIPLVLLTVVFCKCTNMAPKKVVVRKNDLQSVELSLTGGWLGGFSFKTDTSGIFIACNVIGNDSLQYGILPDSIMHFIDSALYEIKTDTSHEDPQNWCSDCGIISLKAVFRNESREVIGPDNSNNLVSIGNVLQRFLDSVHCQKIRARVDFETARDIIPPPPSIATVRLNHL